MPKPKKAARGKHRWIVFKVDFVPNRDKLTRYLESFLEENEWRLFDVLEGNGSTLAILKIPLDNYQDALSQINESESMSTITSSGKIRLARQRLHSIIETDPLDFV